MPTPAKQGVYRTGAAPSAGLANLWVAWNNYLWGLATREHDLFTGASASINSTIADATDYEWYRGWFVYKGNNTLDCNLVLTSGLMKVNITHNSGTITPVNTSTPSTTTTIDISTGTFTAGTQYKISITLNRNGGASAAARVDWGATRIANATNWPTLAVFNDATIPAITDYAAGTTAQQNLQNILEVPTGQNVKVAYSGDGTGPNIFANGGFYYTGQNTLTISYRFQNGTATLRLYGSVTDSYSLTVDAQEHPTSSADTNYIFALNPAHFTVNTWYRWSVDSSSTTDVDQNYVAVVSIGGAKSLSTPPQNFAGFGAYNGSTGTPRLKPVMGSGSTDNLTEIAVQARGTPTIGAANLGFQPWATATIGKFQFDATTKVGYTLGPTMKRPHVFRFLYYRPTTAGTAGTLTLSGSNNNVSLPDNNNGGWSTYDLDTIAGLAYGMFYSIDKVESAYEYVS